jgi:hypothetical protein
MALILSNAAASKNPASIGNKARSGTIMFGE